MVTVQLTQHTALELTVLMMVIVWLTQCCNPRTNCSVATFITTLYSLCTLFLFFICCFMQVSYSRYRSMLPWPVSVRDVSSIYRVVMGQQISVSLTQAAGKTAPSLFSTHLGIFWMCGQKPACDWANILFDLQSIILARLENKVQCWNIHSGSELPDHLPVDGNFVCMCERWSIL